MKNDSDTKTAGMKRFPRNAIPRFARPGFCVTDPEYIPRNIPREAIKNQITHYGSSPHNITPSCRDSSSPERHSFTVAGTRQWNYTSEKYRLLARHPIFLPSIFRLHPPRITQTKSQREIARSGKAGRQRDAARRTRAKLGEESLGNVRWKILAESAGELAKAYIFTLTRSPLSCVSVCNITLDSRQLFSKSDRGFGQIKSPYLQGPSRCTYRFVPDTGQRVELQIYRLVSIGRHNGSA